MKVIDLLNKIAKGEEVPEYIKYIKRKDSSEEIMYVYKENIIYRLDQLDIGLNDEIEILEEEKEDIVLTGKYNNNNDWYEFEMPQEHFYLVSAIGKIYIQFPNELNKIKKEDK